MQTTAAAQCREAPVASGVDLNGYTSAEAADDLDDLRRLLSIRQWNLIGFSYGTRLAQTVLQRHPDGVRSVVLDSVLPIDVSYDETAASSLQRAMDALLAGCANDPACDTRYPDFRARFAKLVADADRTGVAASDHMLRGRDIVEAVGAGLQQPATIIVMQGRLTFLRFLIQVRVSFQRSFGRDLDCGSSIFDGRQPAKAMCEGDSRYSPAAKPILARASAGDGSQWLFRHSPRSRPFKL